MSKITKQCANCGKSKDLYPSQVKEHIFCNKSCHRTFANKIKNPSWTRDISGDKNPMWGKSYPAWNKGVKGEDCHNWKGGTHKRKDGYIRVNIDGKRYLQHRLVVSDSITNNNQVVHHIDGNRSNNSPENLLVLSSQAEHARLHKMNDSYTHTK